VLREGESTDFVMRVENRVWRTAIETRTKPKIDPQIPSGDAWGGCGLLRTEAPAEALCGREGYDPGEDKAGEMRSP